jgi:hypothetical protein
VPRRSLAPHGPGLLNCCCIPAKGAIEVQIGACQLRAAARCVGADERPGEERGSPWSPASCDCVSFITTTYFITCQYCSPAGTLGALGGSARLVVRAEDSGLTWGYGEGVCGRARICCDTERQRDAGARMTLCFLVVTAQ